MGVSSSVCVEIQVAGVTLDQLSWTQTNMTGWQADVDFIGTLDTLGNTPTFTVDTVAPAGTFTVSSDETVAQNYPAMTCLRSSDLATGGEPKVGTVTGLQGSWKQNGTVYVATTGDAATVEAQVRTAGYGGALCVGRLATPTAVDIVETFLDWATSGELGPMLGDQVLMDGGPHVELGVLANVPGMQQSVADKVTAVAPGVGVEVLPTLLTVS